jgi:uncharacterized alpha-E superfamily protein
MLSRVADSIFWMGRYVERAIAATRLVAAASDLQLDTRGQHELAELWNPQSVITCIRLARTAAAGVRDSLSTEVWEQLNRLHLSLTDARVGTQARDNPAHFVRQVRQRAQCLQGMVDSTMTHEEEWNFARLGMFLERADNVARALHVLGSLLEVEPGRAPIGDDTVRWLAVLRSCGSAEAYSRYYSLRVEPARVVEFLLLNPVFPQSVRFSVNAAYDSLRGIAGEQTLLNESNPSVRALGHLRAHLEFAAVDELIEGGLRTFLEDLRTRVGDASNQVTRRYLSDVPARSEHTAAERAAMIMAVQQ